MSLVFGQVTQNAYVTRDIKKAMKFLVEKAGIGPWFFTENRVIPNVTYRGKKTEIRFSVALANSGFIQFELIEPDPTLPSLYNEFLERYKNDFLIQHMSSWPENYDECHANGIARGYEPVFEGDTETGRFVYFQHPERPEFTFEMAHMTPERKFMFGEIAKANQNWDGSNPIRIGRPGMPG
jgi:hypothetical protein